MNRATGRYALQYYPGLLGARGVAASLVLLNHFNTALSAQYGVYFRILASGWNGVYLFFVLSGFLIFRNLTVSLKANKSIDVAYYFRRRILRTWPTYFSVILGMIILNWSFDPPLQYFLTFSQNFFELKTFLPSWSLAVEEQFYLMAPFFAWTLVRWPRSWVLLMITMAVLMRKILGEDRSIFMALDAFALGGCIAYVETYRSNFFRVFIKASGFFFISGLVLVYAPIVCHLADSSFGSFLNLFEALGFSCILISLLNKDFAITRWLSHKGWLFLGQISYPLYLVHQLVLERLSSFGFSLVTFILISISTIFALALLLHFLVERWDLAYQKCHF
ncbi:MAG: acyltransferase family protein [Bdellovibrionota bacterium]